MQQALVTCAKSPQNGLRKAHGVFRKSGLALDIDQTQIEDGPCKGLYVLRLTDIVQYMSDNNKLDRLFGGLTLAVLAPTLNIFWHRFRAIHPELDIFEDFDAKRADPGLTIPVFTHGDEGRGTSGPLTRQTSLKTCWHLCRE